MPDELDSFEIETGETRPIPGRARLRILRYSLLLAFGGSLAANVLLLTFVGIPIAIGWHFALLWLCLAWSVLGAGALFHRTGAALLVWCAGALPIVPVVWLELAGANELAHPVVILIAFSLPAYVAFWCYRIFSGRFTKLAIGNQQSVGVQLGKYKTSLRDLFRWMTLCAILLAFIPPAIQYLTGYPYEILVLGALVVPNAFLLPTIRLACGVDKGGVNLAFKYLLVLCAVIGVASVVGLALVSGNFGSSVVGALVVLLIYFTAGGFLIAGLSILRDHGYRFGPNSKQGATLPQGK